MILREQRRHILTTELQFAENVAQEVLFIINIQNLTGGTAGRILKIVFCQQNILDKNWCDVSYDGEDAGREYSDYLDLLAFSDVLEIMPGQHSQLSSPELIITILPVNTLANTQLLFLFNWDLT